MDVGWGQGSVFVLTGPCPLPHPVSESVQAQGSASQVATAFESWTQLYIIPGLGY